jgi:hypothetical protein
MRPKNVLQDLRKYNLGKNVSATMTRDNIYFRLEAAKYQFDINLEKRKSIEKF